MQAPSYKICPRCQMQTHLTAQFCAQCGRQYQTQFVEQTQVVTPPPIPQQPIYYQEPEPPANMRLIATVWIPTLFAWALTFYSFPVAFLMDVVACVAAITLCFSKNRTDKTNGWVKLALEALSFVSAFVYASQHRGY